MKNFLIRTLSGFIYVLLILGSIVAGPVYFSLLLFIFLIFGLSELAKIGRYRYPELRPLSMYAPAIALYILLFYFSTTGSVYLSAALPGFLNLILIAHLFTKKDGIVFNTIGFTILPLFYLAIPLALLTYFFHLPAGREYITKEFIVGYFILIWLNDTFAYLTGKLFGRHHMFAAVSPNKTWEGTFGGLIFGIAGAWGLSYLSIEMDFAQWAGLAVITIIFGTFGDLFESLLKRRAGLKDSGSIIPGHGGVLDRLDSILISSPFVFLYLYFCL
ncbi:MAG: phosphatidate cytidylyltransferase [Bacteroidales bacterium]|nr:phosphatidate cytidylyltransferase [Bacteroidales bacterium]